jgi:LL-diaminopimelate aminotransferase
MARVNQNYDKLAAGYLFPEIAKRTKAFMEKNPGVKVMRLGIGNTTEPLTPHVDLNLIWGALKLYFPEQYTGYGDEQGDTRLRNMLSHQYKKIGAQIEPSDIFVSDGAKPDSANIQSIFGLENIVAVQDPAYPVYVDTNVIAGRTGKFNKETGMYEGLVYMPCSKENRFFPDVPKQKVDLIYLCSPNNPTGAVATKEQLKTFVDYARENKAVIIFDAAYAAFIKDPSLPRTIYEVEGSKECAIELNSFSKSAGFTGVRLGWSVVPKDLVVEGTDKGQVNSLWNRRQCTFFNGASNIVQEGGLAALSEKGLKENQETIDYYMANAQIIREGLASMGMEVFGGVNAPYVWLKTPNNLKSWDFFDKLLNETHVVGTPGSGFGPNGEGYFRLSSFGHKGNIEEAVASIKTNLRL